MAERRYIKENRQEGSAYLISLYEGDMWLHMYKGYMNPYCAMEMKLYPYKNGTGVSSEKVPGKHAISILKIENFWEGRKK